MFIMIVYVDVVVILKVYEYIGVFIDYIISSGIIERL